MCDKLSVNLERFKKLVDSSGVSRQFIADKINCDVSTITKHYNGDRNITVDYVIKYAKYFNVSADYLLGLSKHSTTNKNLSFVADYLGIDENTCQTIHNKKFEEHTKQFINYFFNNEELFNSMDLYFSTVVLTWIYKTNYKYIPIKEKYKFIYDNNIVKKFYFASLIDILPQARHKYLMFIKDKKELKETITFEIMKRYINIKDFKKEVEDYLNPTGDLGSLSDEEYNKICSVDNITDYELLLKEFENIADFKIELYYNLLSNKVGDNNANNPQT